MKFQQAFEIVVCVNILRICVLIKNQIKCNRDYKTYLTLFAYNGN